MAKKLKKGNTILNVEGIDKTSRSFKKRLIEIANELGMDHDNLAASFSKESKFIPNVFSKKKNHYGLFQCSRVNAGWLLANNPKGEDYTTTKDKTRFVENTRLGWEKLQKMNLEEQLELFVRFYKEGMSRPAKSETKQDLTSTYGSIFSPTSSGKLKDHVIYEKGSGGSEQNSGLADESGNITVKSMTDAVQAIKDKAKGFRITLDGEIVKQSQVDMKDNSMDVEEEISVPEASAPKEESEVMIKTESFIINNKFINKLSYWDGKYFIGKMLAHKIN